MGIAYALNQGVSFSREHGFRWILTLDTVARHNVTALMSPIGDSDSLAGNIIRLIEDVELMMKIAQNGYNCIKNFTWERAYNKLKTLIQTIQLNK